MLFQRNYFATFSHKNGYEFIEKICYFEALHHYAIVQKIRFTRLEEFKTNLEKTPTSGKIFKVLPHFQKFVDQFWYYKAMYQYSITQKIPVNFHFQSQCYFFLQPMLIFSFATRELLLVFHV